MLSSTGPSNVPNCDEDKEQDEASENSNKTDSNNDSDYQPDMLLECSNEVEKFLEEFQNFLIGPNKRKKQNLW